MYIRLPCAAIAALALAAMMAAAQAASLAVSDGDSFRMDGERYRLHDIDAPELHQTCTDARGRGWPCGERAREELHRLLRGGAPQCRAVNRDRFGRIVATCRVAGRDVGEAMVRGGFATAYKGRNGFGRYAEAEAEARAAGRGLWAGRFEPPRQWRQAHPRADKRADDALLSPAAQDWLRQKAKAFGAWLRAQFRPDAPR